jgi:hypothetical protein
MFACRFKRQKTDSAKKAKFGKGIKTTKEFQNVYFLEHSSKLPQAKIVRTFIEMVHCIIFCWFCFE